MSVTVVGCDLANSIFHAHGVDVEGRTDLMRRIARRDLLAIFETLTPCLVAMEACSSAHRWAREQVVFGHDVRLIPPQYAKPYAQHLQQGRPASSHVACACSQGRSANGAERERPA